MVWCGGGIDDAEGRRGVRERESGRGETEVGAMLVLVSVGGDVLL